MISFKICYFWLFQPPKTLNTISVCVDNWLIFIDMQSNIPCNRRLRPHYTKGKCFNFFFFYFEKNISHKGEVGLNYKIGYVPFIKSWKNLQRPKVLISLIYIKCLWKCTWKLSFQKPHHNVILSSEFLNFLKMMKYTEDCIFSILN